MSHSQSLICSSCSHRAGSTAAGREEFLKQLSHIHDGLKETSSKVERRYKSEKVVGE